MVILFISLLRHPSSLLCALKNPLIVLLFIVWPLISATIGLTSGANPSLVIQNILAILSFPFLFGFFSIFESKDSLWAIEKAAITVAIVAVTFWIAILVNFPSAQAIAERLSNLGAGYFGPRELGGVRFAVIYFKATLFFIYAGILLTFKRNYLTLTLMVLALAAAMSKTGVVLMILTFLIRKLTHRPLLIFILACLGIIIVFLGVNLNLFSTIFNALSTDTNTVVVRLDHWNSLVSFFSENPLKFLFGQGAGTTFYSTAVDAYVNNIELDYLNSIRKFGFIWFFMFCLFTTNIAYLLLREKKETWMSIALMVTFLACGTNPVLLTLLFFSILAFSYARIKENHLA